MVLRIITKEMRQALRDKKSLFMMLVFPILIIFILGSAFSQSFAQQIQIPTLHVGVFEESSETSRKAFATFVESINKEMGVEFKAFSSVEEGRKALGDGDLDGFVHWTHDDKMELSLSRLNPIYAQLIEQLMTVYADQSKLATLIQVKHPEAFGQFKPAAYISPEWEARLVKMRSLEGGAAMSAFDYYAITMITMMMFYGMGVGINCIGQEGQLGTGRRIRVTGYSTLKLLLAKTLASFLLTVVQMGLLVLFCLHIFHVNWGSHLLEICVTGLSTIFLSTSLGVALAVLVRNMGLLQLIFNLLVPVMAFFGGCYVPLSSFGSSALLTIGWFSPMTWLNQTVMDFVLRGASPTFIMTLGLNVVLGLFLLVLASARRKAVF